MSQYPSTQKSARKVVLVHAYKYTGNKSTDLKHQELFSFALLLFITVFFLVLLIYCVTYDVIV